jgi:hypothetical protein
MNSWSMPLRAHFPLHQSEAAKVAIVPSGYFNYWRRLINNSLRRRAISAWKRTSPKSTSIGQPETSVRKGVILRAFSEDSQSAAYEIAAASSRTDTACLVRPGSTRPSATMLLVIPDPSDAKTSASSQSLRPQRDFHLATWFLLFGKRGET